MILVDSSVWIDHFAGRETIQTILLQQLIVAEQEIGLGDLMLVEVLQGTGGRQSFAATRRLLEDFSKVRISDHAIAEAAAMNYRHLRARGITVRKTIDTLIATRCLTDDIPLLYSDRDFDPFVQHLGLRSASDALGVN
jgi:predicted nucleic acid-binding protein